MQVGEVGCNWSLQSGEFASVGWQFAVVGKVASSVRNKVSMKGKAYKDAHTNALFAVGLLLVRNVVL